jgi:hydrogenase maturation protease
MNEWEWQALEDRPEALSITVEGVELRKGSRVRLRPRPGGDTFDLALVGQTALVEAIEQDYDGRFHLAVVLESDPGKDLGFLRQPGHRFFFTPEEVEAIHEPRILVAGIGNIFLGDDAFGVEVVRRLGEFPPGVTVRDYGIRSYDLAYALLDGYDAIILVDAAARGGQPGTLYLIEPDMSGAPEQPPAADAHSMNPASVLQLAKTLGTVSARILVLGCEPAGIGGDQGEIGLSEAVSAAVPAAAERIGQLVANILNGVWPESFT